MTISLTSKPLLTIKSHSDVVYQVRFLPGGKSLVMRLGRAVDEIEILLREVQAPA